MNGFDRTAVESAHWDVLIVGAGPVGLYASYYAGFRGLSAVILDSLSEVGGQISAMYPEKYLYDIAGFPQIRGRDLIKSLDEQAGRFDHPVLLGQQATALDGEPGAFVVTTSEGVRIRARAVLLTSGIGTFTPRTPPAGAEYLGRGVSYFVTDPESLADQDVVVLGGGDSAVDWALMLESVARKVTLVHRRDQFRAHGHSVKLLHESRVEILTRARLIGVQGDEALRAVEVDHDGGTKVLDADHVVSALGFIADLGPLLDWRLEMRDRYVAVDQRMATSRDGVYAAGDLADFDGKVRLLSVGFGEAATAVNNLAVRLDPAQSLMPAHSSDQAPPEVA
ncbi:NAD(P)/FAD-dependent oxidoreductase [Streptomyces sp. NPDC090499]|uniref:NAD(P)/FAD-dependent oxidoreductase n=1 Tax=unclassified Streptomyces TaxID=2593676 RepID=UPI00382F3F63